VAGPHDTQDGLRYWVHRAARGGGVALPGRPEQPVQVIDSRDLARLVVRLLVDGRPGAFNAVGPAEPTTMAELIATCARVAGSTVEIVAVPADAVPALFPLVRPEPAWPTQQRSAARARAAGMPATPLKVTVADVLASDRERGEPPPGGGLSPAGRGEAARQRVIIHCGRQRFASLLATTFTVELSCHPVGTERLAALPRYPYRMSIQHRETR
jgi:2'-hydroxyisoflavone reductase